MIVLRFVVGFAGHHYVQVKRKMFLWNGVYFEFVKDTNL